MVRLRGTEDLHNAGQQPIGAGAHVSWLDGQPDRIDPDHRSISRTQLAQAPASDAGQRMTIFVGPRVSSMWMSGSPDGAGGVGICTATKPGRRLPSRQRSLRRRPGRRRHRANTHSFAHPAPEHVGVQTVGQGYGRNRHAGLPTCSNDLVLEFGAVTPVYSPSWRLDKNRSVHVSTMK